MPQDRSRPSWPIISASPGFAVWLGQHQLSLACSSYQTGQLFLIGVKPNGGLNVDQQYYRRAMGLCYHDGQLWLGSRHQVWRLENVLLPGHVAHDTFDQVYVPRASHTTGNIDIHELSRTAEGELVFVNTRFSCLAKLDEKHSFAPIWKPPFVSQLSSEDRCHLNGLCVDQGEIKYVTAAGVSDEPRGWRSQKRSGGVVIDVASGDIVTRGLSMPHSPRVANGHLYVLESGRGMLAEIDLASGARTDIGFGRGFLRGLNIVGNHAIVGSSKPRDKGFKGLPLESALKRRKLEAWSGIFVFDLRSGRVVEWLRFETQIEETFDVAVMPGVACPVSVGVDTEQIEVEITMPVGSA